MDAFPGEFGGGVSEAGPFLSKRRPTKAGASSTPVLFNLNLEQNMIRAFVVPTSSAVTSKALRISLNLLKETGRPKSPRFQHEQAIDFLRSKRSDMTSFGQMTMRGHL